MSTLGYQDDIIPVELLQDFVLEPVIQASIKLASGALIVWEALKRLIEILSRTEIRVLFGRLLSSIPI